MSPKKNLKQIPTQLSCLCDLIRQYVPPRGASVFIASSQVMVSNLIILLITVFIYFIFTYRTIVKLILVALRNLSCFNINYYIGIQC